VHFTYNTFKNEKLAELLTSTVYRHKALVPATPWLDNTIPSTPEAAVSGGSVRWMAQPDVFLWVVSLWRAEGPQRGWSHEILTSEKRSIPLPQGVTRVAVFAVSQTGNLSAPAQPTIR
jgi:hypothetical protein